MRRAIPGKLSSLSVSPTMQSTAPPNARIVRAQIAASLPRPEIINNVCIYEPAHSIRCASRQLLRRMYT
jgi:hypothetical protein